MPDSASVGAASCSVVLIVLVGVFDLANGVGSMPAVSSVAPDCAFVDSVMLSAEVAATAVLEFAMWFVVGGSAIVCGETASVLGEGAVVDVDSSSRLTCR